MYVCSLESFLFVHILFSAYTFYADNAHSTNNCFSIMGMMLNIVVKIFMKCIYSLEFATEGVLFFQKYFPSLPVLISFLSVFWRAHCVAGTQWTETKSLTLQTVSLHASAHMIASATKEQLSSLMESQTTGKMGSILLE